MYSTVQQRAYVVPTHRRAVHHSQVPFDAADSFVVTSVSKPNSKSSRSCWTADAHLANTNMASSNTQKQPLVIQAEPTFIRSYTTMTSSQDTSYSMPSTAILPRTGQVKLTALSHEKTTSNPPTLSRAKTTGFISSTKRRGHRLGHVAYNNHHRPAAYDVGMSELTVGDLQSVLDTEYPVSGKNTTNQLQQQPLTTES